MNLPIQYRQYQPDDESFIFSSWLKSYRNTEDCARMTNDTYFSLYKAVVAKALQNSHTIMACNPSDPTQVYGYLCYKYEDDIPVIQYVYVKFTYRKLGIVRDLVQSVIPTVKSNPLVVTHANRIFDSLKGSHLLIYKPNLR